MKYKNKVQLLVKQCVLLVFLILLSMFLFNTNILKKNTATSHSDAQNVLPTEYPTPIEEPPIPDEEPTTSESTPPTASSTPDKNAWNLVLVNQDYPLEGEWTDSIETKSLPNGLVVDKRIHEALTQMLDDAKSQGHDLLVCSAYRSYQKQQQLFADKIKRGMNGGLTQEEAYNQAKQAVAIPGTSEHHTGLAVDIVATRYQTLDDGMLELAEIQWLYNNCQKYGFIVRYPNGKSHITGIIHEPWHYRYIGVEAATEIMENNLTLEEYLGA